MLGGAYYIWIMLAFFLGCGGLVLLFGGILLIGHWLEKRRTGAKHGFLELPEELRPTNPSPRGSSLPEPTEQQGDMRRDIEGS